MPRLDIYTPEGRFSSGPVDLTRCRKRVWNGSPTYRSTRCVRKAVLKEEGYGWCKQHAPSTVKAKDDARRAQWKAESDRADYDAKTKQLEQDVVYAALVWYDGPLSNPLLQACRSLKEHLAEPRP